jgi:hypothetical protein
MQQYKTLTLQLLRHYPQIYNHLKKTRKVPQTLDHYSKELKLSHEGWKDSLSESKPGSNPIQIAAEAMELALHDLKDRLQADLPLDGSESLLSLDAAISFLRNPSQHE